jgi:hypothetical protein
MYLFRGGIYTVCIVKRSSPLFLSFPFVLHIFLLMTTADIPPYRLMSSWGKYEEKRGKIKTGYTFRKKEKKER